MKARNLKKMLAAALSASLAAGMSMTAFAADQSLTPVEVPIYSYEVVQMIVPTEYAVAFNPDQLEVKMASGASSTATSSAQILSKNYGVVNKGSKDEVITVKLTVEDQNTNGRITFVDTATAATTASKGAYNVHLTVIPASGDGTDIRTASDNQAITGTMAGAKLNNVTMTQATTAAVALKSGENTIGFSLKKAQYTASGAPITLGVDKTNNVGDKRNITGLAATGGYTAFTLGGEMNPNANWTNLDKGLKITPVYSCKTVESLENAPRTVTGAGGMIVKEDLEAADAAPTFTAGTGVGQIKYTAGGGNSALEQIKSITMDFNGTQFDGYKGYAGAGGWADATDSNGLITLDSAYMKYFQDTYPSDTTRTATITYKAKDSATDKTATVQVKLK